MTDRELLEAAFGQVQALQVAVATLQVAVGRLAPEPKISRQDRRMASRLLPALYAAFGCEAFLTAHLLESPTLRALCPSAPKSQATAIGRFLGRIKGVPIDGFYLEASGGKGHAISWSVRPC